MRLAIAIGAVALLAPAHAVAAKAPLHDVVSLNIGLSCQWQQRCISQQERAMKKSLKFVRQEQPPAWRIQLCNRNASRRSNRVDWVGFYNCVRNGELRPLPARAIKKPMRRARPAASAAGTQMGERGR
jgi:hypothetical protein